MTRARQNLGDDLYRDDTTFHRQSTPKEVPIASYRNTTSMSCDMLNANKLTENGHENFKRKEMILKVLQTEDLLIAYHFLKKGNHNVQKTTHLGTRRGE